MCELETLRSEKYQILSLSGVKLISFIGTVGS